MVLFSFLNRYIDTYIPWLCFTRVLRSVPCSGTSLVVHLAKRSFKRRPCPNVLPMQARPTHANFLPLAKNCYTHKCGRCNGDDTRKRWSSTRERQVEKSTPMKKRRVLDIGVAAESKGIVLEDKFLFIFYLFFYLLFVICYLLFVWFCFLRGFCWSTSSKDRWRLYVRSEFSSHSFPIILCRGYLGSRAILEFRCGAFRRCIAG